jgi:hypothetical protein
MEQLREAVRATFAQLGVEEREFAALRESLAINEGRYVGRIYRAGGLMAMWLADLNLVQFYGADGEMLRTFEICQGQHVTRHAA